MGTGFKTLAPQRTGQPEVDRAIDHIKAVVNPVLQQLPNNIPAQVGQLNQSATLLASVNASNPATTVSGSKGGNAALASVIAVLVKHGFIVDTTT